MNYTTPVWGKNEMKAPPVNITEDTANFEVDVVAPGLEKNDFTINLDNGFLTIGYEKKIEQTDKKQHRVEYTQSSFKRSFNISDSAIDTSKIEASYKNGILKLVLPKIEAKEVKPTQIEVK